MKKQQLLAATLIAGPAHAALVTATTGSPDGAAGYAYHVALNASQNDASSFQGSIGTWSWEDESLPGEGNFWRHQSDWLAVSLSEASVFRIEVDRNDPVEDIKLFPSFTIFQNWNDTPEGRHFSSNIDDVQWEENSQLLKYLTHFNNSTEGMIDESMILPAGDYTILLGGNAPAQTTAENRDYNATLSVSPVPEPGTSLLGFFGAIALMSRRKRS